jgi:phosphatidylinositol alpha-mannosyltransferase
MKVGIVVPYSWSFWGGVPEHADNQARALFELGHEPRLIMGHDPPGRLTKLLHPREGRHERPPDYVLPVGRSVIVLANSSLPNLVLSPPSMLRMRRIFQRERFDVIHVHEPFAPILSVYALVIADCPVVVTCHSAGLDMRWYPMGKLCWGVAARKIDHRIAVSELAKASAEPYIGGPIEILPNGVVVPPQADPGGRRPHVVFIGRHERRKGLEILLRAWPDVTRRTGARLRVLGADPLSVRWLMRRKDLADQGIDLLGSVPEDARTRELLEASLLVAPSLRGESFGLILMEAFACATPVVASAIEGYDRVVEADTGLLVPPGDPRSLADAVVGLLENEPLRRRMGAAARVLAEERYSWTRVAGRLVEIYSELTGVRARRTVAVA